MEHPPGEQKMGCSPSISNTRSEEREGISPPELVAVFSDWNKSEVLPETVLSIEGDKCQAWE